MRNSRSFNLIWIVANLNSEYILWMIDELDGEMNSEYVRFCMYKTFIIETVLEICEKQIDK